MVTSWQTNNNLIIIKQIPHWIANKIQLPKLKFSFQHRLVPNWNQYNPRRTKWVWNETHTEAIKKQTNHAIHINTKIKSKLSTIQSKHHSTPTNSKIKNKSPLNQHKSENFPRKKNHNKTPSIPPTNLAHRKCLNLERKRPISQSHQHNPKQKKRWKSRERKTQIYDLKGKRGGATKPESDAAGEI